MKQTDAAQSEDCVHEHGLTIFPEGEAVCLDCGALYIYTGTLDAESLEEYQRVSY